MSHVPFEPRRQKDRAFLGRTVIIVGILASIASIVAVAWAVLPHDDNAGGSPDDKNTVADYQRQVLATCEQVHHVLTTEHPEILIPDMSSGSTDPNDLIRVKKDLMAQILQENLSRSKILFDDLNKKPVPAELTDQQAAAVAAQNAWYASFGKLITAIGEFPRNPKLSEVLKLGTTTGSTTDNTRLNSAMSTLAGTTCQATG